MDLLAVILAGRLGSQSEQYVGSVSRGMKGHETVARGLLWKPFLSPSALMKGTESRSIALDDFLPTLQGGADKNFTQAKAHALT